jgi:hypothetical protein
MDPDGGSTFTRLPQGFSIETAAGRISEMQGTGPTNAPRRVLEVAGDFNFTARVAGVLRPGAALTRTAPYRGGGLFLSEREGSFIRLERARIDLGAALSGQKPARGRIRRS